MDDPGKVGICETYYGRDNSNRPHAARRCCPLRWQNGNGAGSRTEQGGSSHTLTHRQHESTHQIGREMTNRPVRPKPPIIIIIIINTSNNAQCRTLAPPPPRRGRRRQNTQSSDDSPNTRVRQWLSAGRRRLPLPEEDADAQTQSCGATPLPAKRGAPSHQSTRVNITSRISYYTLILAKRPRYYILILPNGRDYITTYTTL